MDWPRVFELSIGFISNNRDSEPSTTSKASDYSSPNSGWKEFIASIMATTFPSRWIWTISEPADPRVVLIYNYIFIFIYIYWLFAILHYNFSLLVSSTSHFSNHLCLLRFSYRLLFSYIWDPSSLCARFSSSSFLLVTLPVIRITFVGFLVSTCK